MILSLPNHGTDWLCGELLRHGEGLKYYEKEFFNPICNPKYADVLATGFGCELVTCYKKIALSAHEGEAYMDLLDEIYQETWANESYNFDKENFSAMKVDFFARHFDIVFLHRSSENVFPPSRLRVWAWYDAIYASIFGVDADCPLSKRARLAWCYCWETMKQKAAEYDFPILDYDKICTANTMGAVIDELNQGWIGENVDVTTAAASIMQTRHYENKTKVNVIQPPPKQPVIKKGRRRAG